VEIRLEQLRPRIGRRFLPCVPQRLLRASLVAFGPADPGLQKCVLDRTRIALAGFDQEVPSLAGRGRQHQAGRLAQLLPVRLRISPERRQKANPVPRLRHQPRELQVHCRDLPREEQRHQVHGKRSERNPQRRAGARMNP
jgi:hypothetical protein